MVWSSLQAQTKITLQSYYTCSFHCPIAPKTADFCRVLQESQLFVQRANTIGSRKPKTWGQWGQWGQYRHELYDFAGAILNPQKGITGGKTNV